MPRTACVICPTIRKWILGVCWRLVLRSIAISTDGGPLPRFLPVFRRYPPHECSCSLSVPQVPQTGWLPDSLSHSVLYDVPAVQESVPRFLAGKRTARLHFHLTGHDRLA